MAYRIQKEFSFSAAHMLSGLPVDHQCSRLHGHNYTVTLALEGTLRSPGFVRDYGELSAFKEHLDAHFEHKFLGYGNLYESLSSCDIISPVVSFNPTAENLAKHFYDVAHDHLDLQEVVAVGVSETSKTWAWYDPEGW